MDEGKVDVDMENFKTVVMVMVAVFVLGALVASSASAETTLEAKWLTGTGNNIAAGTELGATTTGEFQLEDARFGIAILCGGALDGTVSAKGTGAVLTVLTLGGVPVEELKGTGLVCTNLSGCSGGVEAWPEGLPWTTTLFLAETGKIRNKITGSLGAENAFGYSFLCILMGVNIFDTCMSPSQSFEVLNEISGDAEIPEKATFEPLINCSLGSDLIKSTTDVLSPITLNNGELLAVSSE